jgi:hypothetical protein
VINKCCNLHLYHVVIFVSAAQPCYLLSFVSCADNARRRRPAVAGVMLADSINTHPAAGRLDRLVSRVAVALGDPPEGRAADSGRVRSESAARIPGGRRALGATRQRRRLRARPAAAAGAPTVRQPNQQGGRLADYVAQVLGERRRGGGEGGRAADGRLRWQHLTKRTSQKMRRRGR